MISGASDKELTIANARADIILKLDNTSTYESWLIIDTYIEQLQQEIEHLKSKKPYKDLKERNDKLAEQYNLCEIRKINLEMQNQKLKEQYSKLEEKYLKQVPCCNEDDCELYKEHDNNIVLIDKLEKIIDNLGNQLKQRDEVIDEAIEKLETLISISSDYYGCKNKNDFRSLIDNLVDDARITLNILNKYKGDNNE